MTLYRERQVEVLIFSEATEEDFAAWNITYDPTMDGQVAIRKAGAGMAVSIISEAEFHNRFEPVPTPGA